MLDGISPGTLFFKLAMFTPTRLQHTHLRDIPGRDYGRSMVVNRFGIVGTSQTIASAAGADILREGRSAVDAAIAANAVLGVAEPMMNGIGGDLFALVYDAGSKKLYGINASGWAPKALTIDLLRVISELPPNGQGIAALSMLNIMEQFPLREYGHNSAKALHVMIEAKKLAYADLVQYVGDPRFTEIPVQHLVSKELSSPCGKTPTPTSPSCSPPNPNTPSSNNALAAPCCERAHRDLGSIKVSCPMLRSANFAVRGRLGVVHSMLYRLQSMEVSEYRL